MALGTVTTVNQDNISGTITEDESGQTYSFLDKNFPNTNLKVTNSCTYDIDYTQRTPVATNLAAYVPTERVIDSPVSGPLTVNPGETLKVKNGGVVTGTIDVNNGNLIVQGTGQVNGNVTVLSEGSAIVRNGGMVNGSIVVNSGSALKVKSGGMVNGSITVNQANRILFGDATGGGNLTGALTIDKIRKVVITATSKFNC